MRRLALALAVALAASPLAAQEQEKDPAELVADALARLDEHADVALAARELGALGAEAVPALFAALLDARGPHHLTLTTALADAPRGTVAAAVSAALDVAPPPGPDERLQRGALTALRVAGTAADLDLCLRAAEVLGDETYAPRTRELTEALDAIFARDEALLRNVELSWIGIEKRLRTPVARSVANRGGDGALLFLAELLRQDSRSAGMLLSQMGRAAEGASHEAAERAADVVRPYLHDDAQGIVKEAAVTLARLEDDSAVPDLIPLLAEDSRGVAGNVHWALKRITGLTYPQDEGTWAAWHQREREWWASRSHQVFHDLTSRNAAVAGAAAREIAEHRLARHLLAEELAVALRHRASSVRKEAAAALARLGSRAAVPALLASLEEDRDPTVRECVRSTLVRLTGVDPLPEPEPDPAGGVALR